MILYKIYSWLKNKTAFLTEFFKSSVIHLFMSGKETLAFEMNRYYNSTDNIMCYKRY